MMPPMPIVSPIVWRSPNVCGTSKSVRVAGVPADLDLVDQVVGAVERRRPRLVRRDPVAGVRALDELVGREQRVGQAFGVDVVQGDLERPVQLLVRAQVREDPPRELDAARADDRDLRHARESGTRPSGASTSTGNVPGVIVCVAANPSIDKLFRGRTVGGRRDPPSARVRPDRRRQRG